MGAYIQKHTLQYTPQNNPVLCYRFISVCEVLEGKVEYLPGVILVNSSKFNHWEGVG